MYKLRNIKAIARAQKNFFKRDLGLLIFFVTSTCNLRCKYCFNNKRLGSDENDLSLAEIEKIVEKLPSSFNSVLFSGGEPWLRKDFIDVIGVFVKKGILDFGIPSNGVATEIVTAKMKEAAQKYPQASFVFCVSLDPFSEIHNELRGEGAFEKALATAKIDAAISREYPNVLSLINSVISPKSVGKLDNYIDFVKKEISPSHHSLDIVRISEEEKKSLNNFSQEDYETVKKARLKIEKLYRKNDLLHFFYKKRAEILTNIQKEVIENQGRWPVRCPAGQTSVVLYPNGDVSFCENHPKIGNVREGDYNVVEILKEKGGKYLNMTRKHQCDCNHLVYLRQGVEYDFPIILAKRLFK